MFEKRWSVPGYTVGRLILDAGDGRRVTDDVVRTVVRVERDNVYGDAWVGMVGPDPVGRGTGSAPDESWHR